MSDELLLAIDAGTGSCRAVVLSAAGEQLAVGQREWYHDTLPGVPGSQVFDTNANWQRICECIRAALAAPAVSASAIKAISATSMREGMVLYDTSGREIWACPNVDSRASAQAGELIASGTAHEIYDRAGDWVSITAPARFRWIAQNEPDLFGAVAHVGMLGDWVTTRLTGEFVTDPSLGSSSGMFDLATRDWSAPILEMCGLERSVFPPVIDSGTAIGSVTERAAEECGLIAGTPVVVGGADTQLALLGLGVTEPGQFTVVGGSFWQHTVVLDRPLIDARGRLRTLCHTPPGRWMMEGIGFYSGYVMRWFRDAFCELECAQARREGVDPYTLLERKAAELPVGANGVFGIFSNLMQTDRWVHASPAFVGFDVSGTAATGRIECFRAIEEGAAYVSRGHLEIVEEVAALQIGDAVLTGGAAKGTLWPQILADTLDRPVRIPVVKESTALGAAIYAGVGAGLYDDATRTAASLARFERTFEPHEASVARYRTLYSRWTELYQASLQMSEAGLVRPLWRAAGT